MQEFRGTSNDFRDRKVQFQKMRGSVASIRPIENFPRGTVQEIRGATDDFRDAEMQIPKIARVGSPYPAN